ncbi:MAG: CPBP family intramembrane metalloprotease [Acidobacteria bacterium]|nr:CPBP family intramembrane metalloprotease [Acidobacteriota bacterium]
MESQEEPSREGTGPDTAAAPAAASPEAGSSLPVRGPGPSRGERLMALVQVVLCTDVWATFLVQIVLGLFGFTLPAVLHSSRLLALFLLCNSILILSAIGVMVKLRGESWRMFVGSGFRWRREALVGVWIVPLLFVSTSAVGFFFRRFFPELVTAENPMLAIIETPADVLWFLAMGITAGGIKEEIQRAFVFRRFERYLGGIHVGLIVWTLYFGIGHALQGFDNAVGAGVLGLLFGITYIWRQNVVAPVVAHALYDTVVVLYSFFLLR